MLLSSLLCVLLGQTSNNHFAEGLCHFSWWFPWSAILLFVLCIFPQEIQYFSGEVFLRSQQRNLCVLLDPYQTRTNSSESLIQINLFERPWHLDCEISIETSSRPGCSSYLIILHLLPQQALHRNGGNWSRPRRPRNPERRVLMQPPKAR